MLFKIVKYRVDEGLPESVPERLMLLDVESAGEAIDLAVRVLGVESHRDVTLTQFVGVPPQGARVLHNKMTFEEMYDLGPDGLVSALQ